MICKKCSKHCKWKQKWEPSLLDSSSLYSLLSAVGPHMQDDTGLHLCCCCCWVTSVVSDSVRPHRRQPTRLRHRWDSPGKNTGVGCHFLLIIILFFTICWRTAHVKTTLVSISRSTQDAQWPVWEWSPGNHAGWRVWDVVPQHKGPWCPVFGTLFYYFIYLFGCATS